MLFRGLPPQLDSTAAALIDGTESPAPVGFYAASPDVWASLLANTSDGSLGGLAMPQKDARPTVVAVGLPADGLYGVGDVLRLTVTFSEPVTVSGASKLSFGDETDLFEGDATFDPTNSTDTVLAFASNVKPGDDLPGGITFAWLTLWGGSGPSLPNAGQFDSSLSLSVYYSKQVTLSGSLTLAIHVGGTRYQSTLTPGGTNGPNPTQNIRWLAPQEPEVGTTPTRPSHSRTHLAVNSLPLSLITADVFRHTPVNEPVAQPFENIFVRESLGDIFCGIRSGHTHRPATRSASQDVAHHLERAPADAECSDAAPALDMPGVRSVDHGQEHLLPLDRSPPLRLVTRRSPPATTGRLGGKSLRGGGVTFSGPRGDRRRRGQLGRQMRRAGDCSPNLQPTPLEQADGGADNGEGRAHAGRVDLRNSGNIVGSGGHIGPKCKIVTAVLTSVEEKATCWVCISGIAARFKYTSRIQPQHKSISGLENDV